MKNEGLKKIEFETEIPEENVNIPVQSAQDAGLPVHRELTREEDGYFKRIIEAVIFLSAEPVTGAQLSRKCNLDRVNIRRLSDELVDDYAERDGGILLREIAGGYQFLTSDRCSQEIKDIFREQKKERLSRSALEVLSIISYRQPITLPEIEDIRGVSSRSHITTLLSRKLIKPQGYRPVPGRPTLYVTTRRFLNHFSLNSLTDLPALEEVKELKFDEID